MEGKQRRTIKSLIPTIGRLDNRVGNPEIHTRIRGRHLSNIRERIALRDEYTCRVCGRVTVQGEVDHVVPLCLGGSNSDQNLQWICPEPCHREKSEREERERNGG